MGLIIDASCHGTYDADGHLLSPNYPQHYDNNLDCRWKITSPVGNIITLDVSEFHIGEEYVTFDKLNIYHGTSIHGRIQTTLIGYDSMPFVSTGNTIYVQFLTDSEYTFAGFKIKAEAVGRCT